MMEKCTSDLLQDIFNSAVEAVRVKIREQRMYGCELNRSEILVLGEKPKYWSGRYQTKLEGQFLKECATTQLIVANREELVEKFDELLNS